MHSFPYCSAICRQVILLVLSCRIWVLAGENKSFGSTIGLVSSTSGNPTSPSNTLQDARQSDIVLSTSLSGLTSRVTGTGPDPNDDKEGFPTWIVVLVLVCVVVLVSCCVCAFKIRRWRKDKGTYSMWNEQEPNVESMYARDTGVLFEKLDIESSLSEDQCYEIPVDSFVTPQRIYVGGTRVSYVRENIVDSVKTNEKHMSEIAKKVMLVDDTKYSAVTERSSRASDIINKMESSSNSFCGETSQHSSVSYSASSLSERVSTPGLESPKKESYSKPLPVIVTVEPVTCETYQLNRLDQDRVNELVNRPLPDTPLLTPPLLVGESASLDRSLLKRRQEEKTQKPNVIFRTLPRPRKIRQLPIPKPLLSAITRSASSNDVNKEARLNDHVACDPNECTLTRVKKRLSQSLDTLLSSQRDSHFYENPYKMLGADNQLMEERSLGSHVANLGFTAEPPYARVSTLNVNEEDLPHDREHLYARISTCINTSDENLKRHSYASVHYPEKLRRSVLSRSGSRHTYIKIIFGSEDSVFCSSPQRARGSVIRKSRSCSDMSSVVQSLMTGRDKSVRGSVRNPYVNVAEVVNDREEFPRIQFSTPRNSHFWTKPYENCSRTVEATPKYSSRGNSANSDHVILLSKTGYVNVNDTFYPSSMQNVTRLIASTPSKDGCSVENHRPYENVTNGNKYSSYQARTRGSTTEDSSESYRGQHLSMSSSHDSESSTLNESYYVTPKSPARTLSRFNEEPEEALGSEDEGRIEVYNEYNGGGTHRLNRSQKNQQKTLSTYLEGRLIKGLETKAEVEDFDQKEHIYENYLIENGRSCVSDESSGSRDKLSSTSSLSIEEKNEDEPLIPKNTDPDVNGNSVSDGFTEKLELRRNGFGRSTLCGESQA